MLNGSCLCGSVTYQVEGAPRGASACHCRECRRQSGHIWSSAYVDRCDLKISGQVRWYEASSAAKRGFCPTCGSYLFWAHNDEDTISFSLGSIDGATDLTLQKHIFFAEKGDYYEIADNVPQRD